MRVKRWVLVSGIRGILQPDTSPVGTEVYLPQCSASQKRRMEGKNENKTKRKYVRAFLSKIFNVSYSKSRSSASNRLIVCTPSPGGFKDTLQPSSPAGCRKRRSVWAKQCGENKVLGKYPGKKTAGPLIQKSIAQESMQIGQVEMFDWIDREKENIHSVLLRNQSFRGLGCWKLDSET